MGMQFNIDELTLGLSDMDYWNAATSLIGSSLPLGDGVSCQVHQSTSQADLPTYRLADPDNLWTLRMQLTEFPFRQLHDVDLTMRDVAALPDTLRDALIRGGLETLQQVLPVSMARHALADAPLATEKGEHKSWYRVDIDGGWGGPVVLTIGATEQDFIAFLRSHWPTARQVAGPLAGLLSVSIEHSLGQASVSLGEMRDLQAGDMVLVDPAGHNAGRMVMIGGMAHHVHQGENGWQLGTQMTVETETTSHEDAAPGDTAAQDAPLPDDAASEAPTESPAADASVHNLNTDHLVALDELPVKLTFVVAEETVTVADLQGWNSGTVIDLSVPDLEAGMAVSVRANGRNIATGNLVRIDDRLAVRVSGLAGS